ncbi:MAG: hypothetical protein HY869_21565 [Chloroflexi bacterium]|nr:hypothetical protein [Chloroflexota bacterium]
MEYLSSFFAIILPQTPLFLVDLAGLVIAILQRKRHPKVSLLAGIYFLGSFLLSLIGSGLSLLPLYLNSQGSTWSQTGLIMTGIGLVRVALQTMLGIALLYAVFGWRAENPSTPPQEGIPHA